MGKRIHPDVDDPKARVEGRKRPVKRDRAFDPSGDDDETLVRLHSDRDSLWRQIQAFEATRPLVTCLEAADVLPIALDILLSLVRCDRAVGRLLPGSSIQSDGVHLRGFSEEQAASLRADIERGKIFDPSTLDIGPSGVRCVRDGALGRYGLPANGVLEIPLRSEGRIAGGIWVLPGPEAIGEDEKRIASLVAMQAELALRNAERFAQAREKAFIDDVTDLYNARYLLSAFDREVSRAERSRSRLSVLFLDLDRFKTVNDSFGHLVGSHVLRELGKMLQASVRAVDTVARYGGDEFTILLVDTDHGGAMQVAERIRESVASTPFGQDRGVKLALTVSIGVATFPDHGSGRETVLDLSDKAMYFGKARGRNVVCSAHELLGTRSPRGL